jgi:hypothetical protein
LLPAAKEVQIGSMQDKYSEHIQLIFAYDCEVNPCRRFSRAAL